MKLIYESICVFEWNPSAGNFRAKDKCSLVSVSGASKTLPSAATGGDRNLFWCQDLISTRVRFGVEAKVKMPLLADLWLLMLHEAQQHIPTRFSARDSLTPLFLLLPCRFLSLEVNKLNNILTYDSWLSIHIFKQGSLGPPLALLVHHLPRSLRSGNIRNCSEIDEILTSV